MADGAPGEGFAADGAPGEGFVADGAPDAGALGVLVAPDRTGATMTGVDAAGLAAWTLTDDTGGEALRTGVMTRGRALTPARRGRGLAAIATGVEALTGEPPLSSAGTAAPCAAAPSVLGVPLVASPLDEPPPPRVTRPTVKKHANTSTLESTIAVQCPLHAASGPPIAGPRRRCRNVTSERRSVLTSSGTGSAWRLARPDTRRHAREACRGGSRSS